MVASRVRVQRMTRSKTGPWNTPGLQGGNKEEEEDAAKKAQETEVR